MSCYQNLTLNNNTGDLGITSGNTVNLVQAIQNFGIKTPVVDFSISGNVISLYYKDATGAMQVKNVTLPAATMGTNLPISVASTNTITNSIALGVITSSVNVSSVSGNALVANTDGLYVPASTGSGIQVENTPSITLTYQAGILGALSNISAATGNTLSLNTDGLYVPPNTVTTAQIRNTLSATAPVQYSPTTGVISMTQAGTLSSGWMSLIDWNTFNNKLSNAVTVSSSSTIPVLSSVTSGTVNLRGIVGTNGVAVTLNNQDITIGNTATVPLVNAGPAQQIPNTQTSTGLNGTTSVSNGFIISNTWLSLTGPTVPTISDASILSPTVGNLDIGTYRFRLLAVASTGLSSTDDVSINVYNGSVPQDTIYIGINNTGVIPTASQIVAGNSSQQNGANDVSADWTGLTASSAEYTWFAIPNNGGTYFKTKWFVTSFNNGAIGGSTNTFGSYTTVTVNGIVYNVSITNFATQWTGIVLLQA